MGFLLMHCPFCCPFSQAQLISIHKLPRPIEESLDNLNQASIKTLACNPPCHPNIGFLDFPVLILAPTPILYIDILADIMEIKRNIPFQ
jgi:hypothetical protein